MYCLCLLILLAEYTFRSRRDVTDYLALLDQVDDYFASLLLYEQEKAAAGFLMPDVSLEKVQKQCDTIVTIQELAQGTHFLQTTFEDRLVELQAQGILSAEVVSSFLKENDRLLTTVVQPAYATLSEGLYSLETSGSAGQTSSISQASPGGIIDTSGALPKGLALLPDGKTYYHHLLFAETGSSRSEKELVQMLLAQFQEEQAAIRSLTQQSPSLLSMLSEGITEDFPIPEPEEMLSDLQSRMINDFPVSNPPPSFTVKDFLYQTVYSNRAFLDKDMDPVRKLIWYGGYLEGWALYVEFISYDYAADLLEQCGQSDAAQAALLEKHTQIGRAHV